ncbi:MAG: HD domain-containing protein [Candidatus Hadarchaeales archaeon]
MRFVKFIRDPVHGYIPVTEAELKVLDTLPVQRLRGIKQLSIASIVYPGADHSRFSHALGSMHIAGQIVRALREHVEISEDEEQLVRIAALLHDVGHGPFSHSFEEVMVEKKNLTHEDMGRRVVTESELADAISSLGFTPQEVCELSFGKTGGRKGYLKQVIASQVDADKLDFLTRDSYYTGVEYGRVDVSRLIQAMGVVNGNIAIDLKALYALEAFMIARYEMFLAVYYHHAVRAAEIMLHKAMIHADEFLGLTDFKTIDDFLRMDDAYLISKLRELSASSENRDILIVREMLERLDRRQLLKAVYQRSIHLRDAYLASLLSDKSLREEKEKEIAAASGIDPESVFVDVPTLDSIPYYPREIDPMEIPVFRITSDGTKEIVPVSHYSQLLNILKGYVDIIRVYTFPEYRDVVEKAAEKVFGSMPFFTQINI